jgi:Ca2+/Na+ antiporter
MLLNLFLCIAGFVLLYYGAGWLVKGAGSLAARLGVSPLVIGLSVVAIGTSVPEILVSVLAALGGQSNMALGNVVGSNTCNMALGLGLAACFFPIRASRSIVRRDMPIMLLVFVIALAFLARGVVGRLEGIILVALLIVYLVFYYRITRREGYDTGELENALAGQSCGKQLLLIVLGVIFLAAGAKLTVDAASGLMIALGASERFVGLTIVAVGTSLPEL